MRSRGCSCFSERLHVFPNSYPSCVHALCTWLCSSSPWTCICFTTPWTSGSATSFDPQLEEASCVSGRPSCISASADGNRWWLPHHHGPQNKTTEVEPPWQLTVYSGAPSQLAEACARMNPVLVGFIMQQQLTATAPYLFVPLGCRRKETNILWAPADAKYFHLLNYIQWGSHYFSHSTRQGNWGTEKLSSLSKTIILVSDRVRIPNQVLWLYEEHDFPCWILYRDQMRLLEYLTAISMEGNYRFRTQHWFSRGKRYSPHCV